MWQLDFLTNIVPCDLSTGFMSKTSFSTGLNSTGVSSPMGCDVITLTHAPACGASRLPSGSFLRWIKQVSSYVCVWCIVIYTILYLITHQLHLPESYLLPVDSTEAQPQGTLPAIASQLASQRSALNHTHSSSSPSQRLGCFQQVIK